MKNKKGNFRAKSTMVRHYECSLLENWIRGNVSQDKISLNIRIKKYFRNDK